MATFRLVFAAFLAALVLAPSALAVGGNYVFDGGSPAEQAQVRAALTASEFDWSVLPARVVVHIVPGAWPHATPSEVWLDPALLRAGVFSWAVVQDEYAHQLDFLMFDATDRAVLSHALGTAVWCHDGDATLPHSAYGCERFTSTFVWSYWPSSSNSYRPRTGQQEAAAMPRSRFRRLMGELLGRSRRLPTPTLG